ncbi:permease prefix domain 1-containing protein [Rhodococcus sp. NPDC060086]|uniref:permease prefix domain 1-containing protein n=1 Tax=Rhodococcus sp. NPDC060086 TaxID=3347055 RepID=UPI00366427E4
MAIDAQLESQIAQWRGYVSGHRVISPADVDEMEGHLRDQVSDLSTAGLTAGEAFLVAVGRMGSVDAISREFAREHSERLWKQLVLVSADSDTDATRRPREFGMVLALAVGAGLAVKAALEWLPEPVLVRSLSIVILPFLVAYFAWKRNMTVRSGVTLAAPFVAAALVLNVFPFEEGGVTEIIAAIHAPIVLWLVVGVAYVGGEWRSDRRRMDFVRFTGEWVVYMVLLALGGGALAGLTAGTFGALGIDIGWFFEAWVLPFAPVGAMIVAAWLVEAKQEVIENIAPVLTRVFTPLTIVMLLALFAAFIAAFVSSRSVLDVDRELLILMDLILVLVLGLLLYAISARDPHTPPDVFDMAQVVLVVAASAVNVLMLAAMLTRIAEFGFTANKVTALGLNLVLLINLCGAAWLGIRFVRGRCGFGPVERWQMQYLPVYGAWAALVVVAIPPLFGFV